MNNFPIVSIVGRQNVGKSTLFNALLKKNKAITLDYPGVTRDIIQHLVERDDCPIKFNVCDTPGLDIENFDDLTAHIIELSFKQLLDSDVIVFLMARDDIREYDFKLIDLFKKDKRFVNKNIIYCVNKSDNADEEFDLEFFYRQGLGEVLPISAKGRRNIKLLLEKIQFFLKNFVPVEVAESDLKICIVGKPNSGKSSLLNALLGYSRSVVSEKAGTTRDSVNAILKIDDKIVEIVDTAGIRKESKNSEDSIEFYSYTRVINSIEAADVVIHLFDATKGIGEFDKKIFNLIREKGKPLILVISKWDLVDDKDSNTLKEYKEQMYSRLPPTKEVNIMSISALEGQRVHKLVRECLLLQEKANKKVSTHSLNEKLRKWMSEGKMSTLVKKRPKILYVTQISTCPFKLILFVNHIELFTPNVLAYIRKKLIEEFELTGIPLEFTIRSDRDKE